MRGASALIPIRGNENLKLPTPERPQQKGKIRREKK